MPFNICFCLIINFITLKQVPNKNPDGPRYVWLICSPGDPNAEELTLDKIKSEELFEPPVIMVSIYQTFIRIKINMNFIIFQNDMVAALATQKPTVGEKDLLLQKKFTEEFGQEGSQNQ